MSEFRWDPLKATWVVMVNERTRQPHEFFIERAQVSMASCPFCPGQEAKTPPEVYALRPGAATPDGPGWQVRVVPNKFPVLRIEGGLNRHFVGLHETMQGIGAHEVIIETPDHDRALAELSVEEVAEVLRAYQARLLDLRRDQRFRYLQIYKNHGAEAGAPVSHAHSQLMAVPIMPPVTRTELVASRGHFLTHKRCLTCDLLAQELAAGQRMIINDGQFLVLAPYASCFPFETHLYPQRHNHDFATLTDPERLACAAALRNILRRLRNLLQDPPFNFILHTAPPPNPRPGHPGDWRTLADDYHWHIELVPRLSRIAGFEWGSGFFLNPMLPEDAARFLRDTDPEVGT